MVTITNGMITTKVTSGAFQNIFKGMGYNIIDDHNADISGHPDDNQGHTENNDDKFVSEIIEKPIGEWSKEELKKFATIKGIDISGMRPSEVKAAIKSFIDEE